jgi:cytochrome P450
MWTREGRNDPLTWYNYMRENEPVAWHGDVNAYGVFRYDDVRDAFLNHELWSNQRRFDRLPESQRALHINANTMNGLDPPEQSRMRLLAMPAFAPREIGKLRQRIADISAQLLDAALAKGTFDVVADYAHKLPQVVINEILGVPREDFGLAKGFADRMEAATGRYTGAAFTDPEELRAINREYREYFAPIIEARRARDHGDVMSVLVRAEEEGGRLNNEELVKLAMLINRGGAETTMTLITHMIRSMLLFPDQFDRVRADRSLIPSAVEETLRYFPPSHSMARVATRDVTVRGVSIPGGSMALLWMPSANHDSDAFPNPDVFDVGRTPNRHLSLGFGVHLCIGMHLARLEAQIALEHWLDRIKDFRRSDDTPVEWSQVSLVAVYPRSFPVTIRRH